jgi:hypothetical protein
MSTMKRLGLVVVLGAVSAVGCQKKEEAPEENVPAATAEVNAKPEVTPEQKLDQDIEALAAVIDMPEDYIQIAEEEINDDNLGAELEKLEKELAEEEKANPQLALPAAPAASVKSPVKPAVTKKPAAPKPAGN